MSVLQNLREKHPVFRYQKFDVSYHDDFLQFEFTFQIDPDITFHPTVSIHGVTQQQFDTVPKAVMDNLAFHLGLMEIPSYWKATCSPLIQIDAGYLSDEQKVWWRDVLIQGMGEFYYVNQIDFTHEDFVRIESGEEQSLSLKKVSHSSHSDRVLIPMGGGKDSAVTVEVLRKHVPHSSYFTLNPTQAATNIIGQFPLEGHVHVTRVIDPKLLELNSNGYLNGHTPFSAYLAFLSVISAVVLEYGTVVLSNERSSNEANISYLGHQINHQYSKSFEFEQKFREYIKEYVVEGVNFFSFLRPLFELQIAALFSGMKQYHHIFRSCNRGQKQNVWCLHCPKCLFAYLILSPFLSQDELHEIFGQNLFEREDMWDEAMNLAGVGDLKPFECVGTFEENKIAFYLTIKKYQKSHIPLPIILERVQQRVLSQEKNLEERAETIFKNWNEENNLPKEMSKILFDELQQIQSN